MFCGIVNSTEIGGNTVHCRRVESQTRPCTGHVRFSETVDSIGSGENAIRRRAENQGRPINDDDNNFAPVSKPQNGIGHDLNETLLPKEIEFDKNAPLFSFPLENHIEELSGFLNDIINGVHMLEVNGEEEDSDATCSSEVPMEGTACTEVLEVEQEDTVSEDDSVNMLCIAMNERVK